MPNKKFSFYKLHITEMGKEEEEFKAEGKRKEWETLRPELKE